MESIFEKYIGKIILASPFSRVNQQKDVQVTPKGGRLEIGNCYINFPKSAVDDIRNLSMKLYGDQGQNFPNGDIMITHRLDFGEYVKLFYPVEVCMPTWYSVNTEDDDVTAHIACLVDDGIEVLDKRSLRESEGNFRFKTDILTSFFVALPDTLMKKVLVDVDFLWYLNKEKGTFTVLFTNGGRFITNDEMQTIIDEEIFIFYGRMTIEHGDHIMVSVSGEAFEDTSTFESEPFHESFSVTDRFIRDPMHISKFLLLSKPAPQQVVEWEFKMIQNDVETPFNKSIAWPGEASPAVAPVPSVMDEVD